MGSPDNNQPKTVPMEKRLRLAGFLVASVIRAYGMTWRIDVDGWEHIDAARRLGPNLVSVFWHGRMLPLAYIFRDRNLTLLASRHRDGELMGQIVRHLGFGHVRGSSTRGGAVAIREMMRRFESGLDLGITVDGPVGPRHVVKPGAIEIARLTGAPLVPVAVGTRRPWVASSWDAFQVPRPFARLYARFGEPIVVPADADPATFEAYRLRVEKRLKDLTIEVDEYVQR